MAIEQVHSFLLALEEDETLAVRADDAYVAALRAVASSAGFEFSEDELRVALDTAATLPGSDLQAAELDQVVGGASTAITFWSGSASATSQPYTNSTRFGSFSRLGFSR
ncbi:MAG: Nif11-like leader peptide family natural product precursor [Gammaproteobacteria bacterium]|nr:Nif11-like leader peptide family natural product precursor [Gammaproteobacteria bacterium]